MPKKRNCYEATRSKSTLRKPFRDLSNRLLRPSSVPAGDESLDRLLLVHSHLSSLIHQIDELVVQALKLTGIKERKEIESFADVLSEIQVSLKPWVVRFHSALSSVTLDTENNLKQSSPNKLILAVNDAANDLISSPEETKWDSLISPSPLVSWRPDCNVDGGKQLFLLTPLPRSKAFSSKYQPSAKSVFGETNTNTVFQPFSLFTAEKNVNGRLIEGVPQQQTPRKVSFSNLIDGESKLENELVSPANYSMQHSSMLFRTPRLKTSPPKSCILLEPITEISGKNGVRQSTPYAVEAQNTNISQDSESHGGSSDCLNLKYPELFGIRAACDYGNRRKVIEEPKWLVSPPKTCVLMELPEEKPSTSVANDWPLSRTTTIGDQLTNLSLSKEHFIQDNGALMVKRCREDPSKASVTVESTPLLKEPESNLQTGKRAGENTLKRELWMKFEAASSHGIRFLDLLEEVSSDETSPADGS